MAYRRVESIPKVYGGVPKRQGKNKKIFCCVLIFGLTIFAALVI